MSGKEIQIKGRKFREVNGKGERFRVIKIGKMDDGIRSIIIHNNLDEEPFKVKIIGFNDDLTSTLNASPVHLNPKADMLTPPKNPNRRPTRINADRSLSRMRARDRALVGRGQ